MVLVTALAGAGQFTLFSYIAPYFKTVIGASSNEVTLLFVWFGVFGVIGNALASRYVDRFGADRAVGFALVLMAVSLLAFPLASNGLARRGRPRALGAGVLLDAVDAAGAPRRRGAGAGAGADGAQQLGDLPRPGGGRVERRLADRAPRLRPAQLRRRSPGSRRRSRSASGRAGRAGRRHDGAGRRGRRARR